MNKLAELKTTNDLVKRILEEVPMARNSDNYLYYLVCLTIAGRKGIDVWAISMPKFLLNLKEYGFPQFETVGRARRKMQAEYPELAGNENVEAQRMLNEEIFKNYAIRGI